jgi:hypothetical protein
MRNSMYRECDAQHYLRAFGLSFHQWVEPMVIRGKIVRISSLYTLQDLTLFFTASKAALSLHRHRELFQVPLQQHQRHRFQVRIDFPIRSA